MTESDIINFMINLDNELKYTYLVYQNLLIHRRGKIMLCKGLLKVKK